MLVPSPCNSKKQAQALHYTNTPACHNLTELAFSDGFTYLQGVKSGMLLLLPSAKT